ncbi:hypothetical protein FFT09_11035 [Saccharomonospora piscinae]|uniref:hypothetical protein n=1 Tax=Saccharomonospora piscinae TaxID=687388 RepID=UPI00110647BF|nr:hypothetical protein [Saccharomonospora piscinae]TLW93875.1 hypothetical protein FFT09_11035 [Saccharomonospora piscinae]
MRNAGKASSGPAQRALRGSAVSGAVAVAALLTSAGTASADDSTLSVAVQAEPNAMTFGLLGPVGLVAVALGVLGMVAGVVRQRRNSRPEAAVPAGDAGTESEAPVPAYAAD